jgi:hypothetical protein
MEATTEVAQESSFERFFTDGYVRLVRAMYLLTGSMAEAEDLAQEAMARVYERWERQPAHAHTLGRALGYVVSGRLPSGRLHFQRRRQTSGDLSHGRGRDEAGEADQ